MSNNNTLTQFSVNWAALYLFRPTTFWSAHDREQSPVAMRTIPASSSEPPVHPPYRNDSVLGPLSFLWTQNTLYLSRSLRLGHKCRMTLLSLNCRGYWGTVRIWRVTVHKQKMIPAHPPGGGQHWAKLWNSSLDFLDTSVLVDETDKFLLIFTSLAKGLSLRKKTYVYLRHTCQGKQKVKWCGVWELFQKILAKKKKI